ncbi:hypothetical protein [Roseateles terrae]|uniref:Uncharacterized protein n=1 Tax=Roseateles terrae TaxID=431060 RepID=A0ABR6GWE0_9BURK|nr:hypothetical protein [Roseateles terrae]MBB3196427.1 hypothetical protein [Roseateles terrae]
MAEPSRGWAWVIGSPAFAAVVTLLVVMAGAAASLFTEGIRSHSPMPIPDGTSALGAWLFWSLSIVAVGALLVNQVILRRTSLQERADLDNSLKKLDTAVRRLNTLPNEAFLPSFQDSYGEAFAVAVLAIASPEVRAAQVDAAIRAVLAALADTARDFDGGEDDAVYRAHLMLFRPREMRSLVSDSLGLPTISSQHLEYAGALETVVELSTSLTARGEIDAALVTIHLPIPAEGMDYFDADLGRTRSSLIPGAATSYVKGTFDSFATIDDFLARLKESSLDRTHVGTIQRYFVEGTGRSIRSFATLPVMDLTLSGVGSDEGASGRAAHPLAVLVLQSSAIGLLADNGATLFAPLAGPFLNLLAMLLLRREEFVGTLTATPTEDRQTSQGPLHHEQTSFQA